MVGITFIVVVSIYSSTGALLDGLLSTLIFGIVGVVAQVLGARLLEWVAGMDVGAMLAAEQVRAQPRLVGAVLHIALGAGRGGSDPVDAACLGFSAHLARANPCLTAARGSVNHAE